jgi:hypothetical protein
MGDPPTTLGFWKDLADIAQSTLTVIAIAIGGVWTYVLFVRRRERFPKAVIGHQALGFLAGDRILLHVTLRISNIGAVILRLTEVRLQIQQILPFDREIAEHITNDVDPVQPGRLEVDWPLLAQRKCTWVHHECYELEPGETDEFPFDFVIPAGIRVVRIYSYTRNIAKRRRREIGWNTTSTIRLSEVCTSDKREFEADGSAGTAKEEPAAAFTPTITEEGTLMPKQTTDSRPSETRQGPPKQEPRRPATDGGAKPKK